VVVFDAWSLADEVVRGLARRRKDGSSRRNKNRRLDTANFHRRDANGWAMPLIPAQAYRPVTVRAPTDWCVALAVRLPGLGKVRIVVSCEHESLTGRSAGLVPNRVDWSAAKIIGLYLQRWPTEIVQTRMTTRADRSPGARGDHGPPRPLAVGDEDAIDPPLHQSSAVGTREGGHGRRHLPAQRVASVGPGGAVHLGRRLGPRTQLPVFSANNGPVHVRERGRQTPPGALSPAGEGDRSGR
jgi:hypothetical protein